MTSLAGPSTGGRPPIVLPDARENLRGILAMLAAMAFFVTNDMFVKLASESVAIPQIIFVRGLMTLALIAAFAIASGALKVLPRSGGRAIGLRTVGEIGATVLYLAALAHMPLANITAILLAMPVIMTVISALFLGEVVRWRRWAAVVAGLAGMLLVVRPGSAAFDIYALLAVASLAFVALRDLSSRYLPQDVPTPLVAVVATVAVTATGGLLAVGEPWTDLTGEVLAYLACSALFLGAGYLCITEAMRHGEVSVVAPFRYTIIVWALIYGVVVWGELPDAVALAGTALIVLSGLYVFYRESRVRRSQRLAQASAGGRP